MAKSVSDKEYEGVTSLPGPERYSHFVRQVVDFGEVWSLRSQDGWVAIADDAGQSALPVWPHRRYAESFATEGWADTAATPIPLDAWLERWLPGLTRDGQFVAVFPVAPSRGVMVTPGHLQADLQQEMQRYE